MNKRNLVLSLVASIVAIALSAGYLAFGARPKLGLDLQGGISAIYSPVFEEGQERPADFDAVLDETIAIIRERVDSLGVAEPEIARQGDDVLVQLPGLDDPERAREVIGTTAQLSFRQVEGLIFPGLPEYDETPACESPEYEPPALDEGGIVCSAEDESVPLIEPPTEAPTGSPTEAPTGTGSPTATETGTPAPTGTEESSAGSGRAAADVRALAPASPTPTASPSPAASPTASEDELAPAPEDPEEAVLPLKYRVGPAALTGDDVEGAQALIGPDGNWSVALDLDSAGADKFAQVTSELACLRDQGRPDQLAIVLDGRVESAPGMNPTVACGQGITGGEATITVGNTEFGGAEGDARDLALVLKTGALPITLEPSTFETVSPTLGEDSLRAGLLAAVIGLLLVAIYLVVFYRALGLIAIAALVMFGVVITAMVTALGGLGFTLSLAGIAGVVVSIGIAADSSILFFERLRDEVRLGKTIRTSAKRAFDNAFRTNLAGNTVTIAAAAILYFLAVGPVRGFAFTLGLATALDIVILYVFTRPTVGLLAAGRRLTRRNIRAEPVVAAGGAK